MPDPAIHDIVNKLKSTNSLEGLLTKDTQSFYNPFLVLIVSYEAKLKILEGNIDKYAKRIVSLKKDVKYSIDEQNRLTNVLENKTGQLVADKEVALKNCEEPYEDLTIRDFNQNILNLQYRNEQLLEEIDNQNALKANKLEEIAMKQEKIEHLELNHDTSDRFTDEINIRIGSRQKIDFETELTQLEERVIALRNQKILVETELFEKTRENDSIKFKLNTLENERQHELDKITVRKEKLEAEYKYIKADYEAFSQRYRESLKVLHDREAHVDIITQELTAKNEKIQYLKQLKAELIQSIEYTNFEIKSEQDNKSAVLEVICKQK